MKTLVITVLAAALVATAAAQKITTFSVPGAGTGKQQGTLPSAINHSGEIAGSYVDSGNVSHGFTYQKGQISTFDAFGTTSFTVATTLSSNGTIVGYFDFPILRKTGFVFGFLRSPAGAFTLIQAAIGPDIFTYPFAVSDTGIVAGYWQDAATSDPIHSFVRDGKGVVTTFDGPNDVGGTFATAVNSAGEIAGFYQDANGVHGFVRDQAGNLAGFDPPGSTNTVAFSINDSGQVGGYYIDSNNIDQGYIRNVDGSFTTFTVPGATQLFAIFGHPVINNGGEVAGVAVLNNGKTVGYTRSVDGTIREFQVSGDLTIVTGINAAGHLTGLYQVSLQGSYNGFVF